MKSYPESELLCLLGSIWIADMLPWNSCQQVSCCAPSGLYLNCWHTVNIISSLCLSSFTYFLHSILLTGWHSAGGQCSSSCESSLQCKTISHSFQFPSLIYSQLHRHLLCILSLVWLILFSSYIIVPHHSMDSYPHLSWTFLLDCPARLQFHWWLHQGLGNLFQDPACTGWSTIGQLLVVNGQQWLVHYETYPIWGRVCWMQKNSS